MDLEWLPYSESIDYLEKNSEYQEYLMQIHVDTRDFAMFFSDTNIHYSDVNMSDNYYFKYSEVVDTIKKLHQKSGGQSLIRYIKTCDKSTCRLEMKYLRFYKTLKGYLCTTRENKFKSKDFFDKKFVTIILK